jgi:hypothetical protein
MSCIGQENGHHFSVRPSHFIGDKKKTAHSYAETLATPLTSSARSIGQEKWAPLFRPAVRQKKKTAHSYAETLATPLTSSA